MKARRSHLIFVKPKKFYRPKELADYFPMSEKALLQNAMLCGALYRVHNRKLINVETLMIFVDKVGNLAEEIGGKYCQVKDAAVFLGVNEEQATQIASDADALIKVRQLLLVDKEALYQYVKQFTVKVNVLDIDDIEEQAKIERRLQKYV